MSAVGDARKRLNPPECLVVSVGLSGYFVAPDAFGEDVVWSGTGPGDHHCRPVLEGWRVKRADPVLWAAIVRMVAGDPS